MLNVDDAVNMPIDVSGLTYAAGQTYDYVIATSGAANFTLGTVNFQPTNCDPSGVASPSSFSLVASGDGLILRFTPVHEPAFAMAICLGGAAGQARDTVSSIIVSSRNALRASGPNSRAGRAQQSTARPESSGGIRSPLVSGNRPAGGSGLGRGARPSDSPS